VNPVPEICVGDGDGPRDVEKGTVA